MNKFQSSRYDSGSFWYALAAGVMSRDLQATVSEQDVAMNAAIDAAAQREAQLQLKADLLQVQCASPPPSSCHWQADGVCHSTAGAAH